MKQLHWSSFNFALKPIYIGHKAVTVSLLLMFNCLFFVKTGEAQVDGNNTRTTVCNPLNLNYRFSLDKPSRREAADPTVINFKGEYYLFASKSDGYWHSSDLIKWDLVTTGDLPLEDYAPTAVVIGDSVYFMASSNKQGTKIYKSADPKNGKWAIANPAFPISLVDPDLFLDDNGRLYLYYGCSNVNPTYVVELDRKTLMPVGKTIACIYGNNKEHGWERFGDYNEKPIAPWIEGSWMTKFNGKYYLQYASPGTEFKSYCDGLYIGDSPLGPFRLAADNPFSHKPEGFIASAGHSSTFKDNYGNYWRISTMTISVKHPWERRLGLFPAFFEPTGDAYTYTGFGDFPIIIPHKKVSFPAELSGNLMLLSYNKPVTVSSTLNGYPASNAVDEDIRTYWSAASGNSNEWLSIDLQHSCSVKAVQLNFAEQGTEIYGRTANIRYQYKLEYSNDGISWKILADKSSNTVDAPHDYLELPKEISARYLRVINYQVPGGTFALSGFRVFGHAGGALPSQVQKISVLRNMEDPCRVKLQWAKSKAAIGYNIRYGTAVNKLYQNYQVFGQDSLEIRSLNKKFSYYFTIDSFNENGIQKGIKALLLK